MKKKMNLGLFEPESEGDGSEEEFHCQQYRRMIMCQMVGLFAYFMYVSNSIIGGNYMFKNEGTEYFKINILNCNNILNITDLTVSHSIYSTVAHSRKVVSHKMIISFGICGVRSTNGAG